MKIKTIIVFALMAAAFAATGQNTFVQLIQDSTGKYRFQRVEVLKYENLSDTLITARFPEKWLDTAELKTYQQALITQYTERLNEQRRLLQIAKSEVDVQVALYDQMNGEGAWLRYQKTNVLNALQGNWILTERNGEVTKTDIVIEGNTFKKNNNKTGTITVTDDLQVLLVGYFNQDITFDIRQNGTLTAKRGKNNYTLKRP